jgi:hypothetical protein
MYMQELWAIIFKPWPDEPVYHGFAGVGQTLCGRKIGLYHPMIPMKHALKFARPCRSCYPS